VSYCGSTRFIGVSADTASLLACESRWCPYDDLLSRGHCACWRLTGDSFPGLRKSSPGVAVAARTSRLREPCGCGAGATLSLPWCTAKRFREIVHQHVPPERQDGKREGTEQSVVERRGEGGRKTASSHAVPLQVVREPLEPLDNAIASYRTARLDVPARKGRPRVVSAQRRTRDRRGKRRRERRR